MTHLSGGLCDCKHFLIRSEIYKCRCEKVIQDMQLFNLLFSACLSVRLSVVTLINSVIFNRIYSKFHIWIASINLWFKFEYGFCLASDNQDGWQNGRHLSISAVEILIGGGHFASHLGYPMSDKTRFRT